jgi:hypothetical protein
MDGLGVVASLGGAHLERTSWNQDHYGTGLRLYLRHRSVRIAGCGRLKPQNQEKSQDDKVQFNSHIYSLNSIGQWEYLMGEGFAKHVDATSANLQGEVE